MGHRQAIVGPVIVVYKTAAASNEAVTANLNSLGYIEFATGANKAAVPNHDPRSCVIDAIEMEIYRVLYPAVSPDLNLMWPGHMKRREARSLSNFHSLKRPPKDSNRTHQ